MSGEGDEIVRIDGSLLEGGGQILRNATALSAIMGKPVQVYNIRAGRPKPGIMAQHLTGLQLLAQMCDARTRGAELGATEVTFCPRGWVKPGAYEVDCKTAGALSLLLQSVVPPLLFSGSPKGTTSVDMRGGTNVSFAPQIETLCMGLFPLLTRCLADGHLEYTIDMMVRGCYPKGGGRVVLKINHPLGSFPRPPIVLTERGKPTEAKIYAWSSGSALLHLAHRMAESARREFLRLGVEPAVEVSQQPPGGRSPSPGTGVAVSLTTDTGCILSADYLLQRGQDVDSVGRLLINELNKPGVCVDAHTEDQLVVFMALADGKSSLRCSHPLTNHTLTAMHVAEKLCGVKFEVTDPDAEGTCLLSCQGLGWTPATAKRYY